MPSDDFLARFPETSGIYQIRCLRNGKIYVGSSVNIGARWQSHCYHLRKGRHHNPHLQSAWKRYGESAFEFVVLELVDRARLLTAEQLWIERTECTSPLIGFNLKKEATSAGLGIGRVRHGFRDPGGQPITIVGLYDFCRRNRLDYRSMHRLATGDSKLKSYRGWTHANSVRRRDFIKVHRGFVDPKGRKLGPIRNLAAFCKELGLDNTHMTALAKGRIVSYRGWTHILSKPRLGPKVYTSFIAPDGATVQITNLAAFCRAAGLSVVHMHQVKSGKRPRHKGWTWKHDAHKAPE